MLEVQKYLQDNTLEELVEDFSIKTTHHADGRVILNYHMIDSYKDKFNPIVMECRGLVLDSNNNYDLVARSFPRFFNLGEHVESQKKFCWEGSSATDKEDGSLLIIYYWNHDWRINTRGSFGEGVVNNGVMTWHELAELALPDNWRNAFRKDYTYVCELCSLHNKIVREYKNPQIFLLTTFHGEIEHTPGATDNICRPAGLKMPEFYRFRDAYDVSNSLNKRVKSDKTFEGYVIRDKYNRRLKVKSALYVKMHRQINNHVLNNRHIFELILSNEDDEFVTYFPEYNEKIKEMKKIINNYILELNTLWSKNKLKNQKDFALSVKDHTLSYILFNCKRYNLLPINVIKSNITKISYHLSKIYK